MNTSGATFESVWEMFQETDRRFKENARRFKETDKKIKKLEELFTGQWGKLIESLVEGDLVPLLQQRGISVNETAERIKREYNGRFYEIDIIAKNGKEVVLVEVKTTLKSEDVKHYLDTLQVIREVFPWLQDKTVYAAVAFLKVDAKIELYAARKGLFVIRATGNSASIVNPKSFTPKTF